MYFLPRQNYSKSKFKVKLRGLEEDKSYRIITEGKEEFKSGAYLMNYGLELELKGDYASSITHIKGK
ncbi:GH36 C-terminal domain-containing protein [Caloramator sp. mosi_1]|uniref:GH36 C-terminal domain-containing protein n=1 Tax=Caloramator sp. mosi_1 TaxID=3023090 RepID=UPI003FCD38C5